MPKQEHPDVLSTRINTKDIVENSWDQNMHIWLRNMQGTSFDLGTVIRDTAERTVLQNKPMEVLEVCTGIPLKSLELRGSGFRSNGDYLLYGRHIGSHQKPIIDTTVISPHDWTAQLLQGEMHLDPNVEKDLYRSFLLSALDTNFDFIHQPIDEIRGVLSTAYSRYKRQYAIDVHAKTDIFESLEFLIDAGKQFDLAFLDSTVTPLLHEYLLDVQKLLRSGGVAYLPIEWWSPASFDEHGGVREKTLWNQTVNGTHEKLEDYLCRNFPSAFEIAHFPGAKTLIIKGEKK